MNKITAFLLLLMVTGTMSCSKYEEEIPVGPMPVTTAVKSGDWMVNTFYENGVNLSSDIGLAFIKFNPNGTLAVTRGVESYAGTWSETKTAADNTLTINITTTDSKLKKVNNTWKVTSVTEYFIDVAVGTTTMNLMKH